MQRGNTELSREARPIISIESHRNAEQQYAASKSEGITIVAYDELSDFGYVPWVAVFKEGDGCIYRVRADQVAIFYSHSHSAYAG